MRPTGCHPAANKRAGVARLTAEIGVPLSETAIIGDMPNDISMLQRAGLAIAMGQAPEPVKASTQWVTGSNAEEGVALAIDQILTQHERSKAAERCNPCRA